MPPCSLSAQSSSGAQSKDNDPERTRRYRGADAVLTGAADIDGASRVATCARNKTASRTPTAEPMVRSTRHLPGLWLTVPGRGNRDTRTEANAKPFVRNALGIGASQAHARGRVPRLKSRSRNAWNRPAARGATRWPQEAAGQLNQQITSLSGLGERDEADPVVASVSKVCRLAGRSSSQRRVRERSAGGGNRTHTPRRERDFESRASASFTTPAS